MTHFFPPLPLSDFNQDQQKQWLAEQTISADKIIGRADAATVVVASSTSPYPGKAHHVADATADDVEFQAALDDLPAEGGTVIFLEGTYNLAGTIAFPNKPVVLKTIGKATLNIASGTTFTWAGDSAVVFDGFTFTGGVAGMNLIQARGDFWFVNNTVEDFTVRRFIILGGTSHVTRAFIKGNKFEDVSIETTGTDFNNLGIIFQSSNGIVMSIASDNTFKNITHTTHTGAGYFLTYSEAATHPLAVSGNVVEDATTLTGYFGGITALVSHNVIDGAMVTGTHTHTHVEADVTDLDHTDTAAIHDNVAAEISAITEKVSPVSADLVLIEDSAASNAKKKVQIGNLNAGGGWQAWSPTYANLTVGNGTVVARYTQIGKLVIATWGFTLGTTSAIGTRPTISLPVTAATKVETPVGPAFLLDAGVQGYQGMALIASTTTIEPFVGRADSTWLLSSTLGALNPFTWGNADQLNIAITYEAA